MNQPSPSTPRSPGSARWWFENRTSGEITVAQFPNWPLWGIAGAWIIDTLAETGSTLDDTMSWVQVALWAYWGGDELLRGVNPWRRLLGIGVLAWLAWSLLG